MDHPGFFDRAGPFPLIDIVHAAGADIEPGASAHALIDDVRPLNEARANHISFIDNRKYLADLDNTKAGACFVPPDLRSRLAPPSIAVVTTQPYHAFARALALFYPSATRPLVTRPGAPPVDPAARIEDGVTMEPGVIIGREAEIGRGTYIAAGAIIGERVAIGRDCYIGANSTITHSLIGDRVTIHAGVRTGQDGFGFAIGRDGHLKVPQIGRVIIQDNVEIGANTTIDRGALKDTIIGEGTKIDNLVQIGHNVVIGRHCLIVAQAGISGSTVLGDFVAMGGQSGMAGHLKVGNGARLGGASHIKDDMPPGSNFIGTPAVPVKDWAAREVIIKRLMDGEIQRKKS